MTWDKPRRLVKSLGVLACVLLSLVAVQVPVGAAMLPTHNGAELAFIPPPGGGGGGSNGQCLQLVLMSANSLNYMDSRIKIAVKNTCGRDLGKIRVHIEGRTICTDGTFVANFNGDSGLSYLRDQQTLTTSFKTTSYCSNGYPYNNVGTLFLISGTGNSLVYSNTVGLSIHHTFPS